jgi:hypothetical protein
MTNDGEHESSTCSEKSILDETDEKDNAEINSDEHDEMKRHENAQRQYRQLSCHGRRQHRKRKQ